MALFTVFRVIQFSSEPVRNTGFYTASIIYNVCNNLGLETLDTIGNCQRPVYLNICIKQRTCENLSSIGRRSCEILMKEKTPLPHEVVCFQMLDFETSNSKLEVSKSNSWRITSFSKTMSLQREPFLTMFYTTNLSPLLVIKWGFMLIIILSNYQ